MICETMHELDEWYFCYENILFEMLWWSMIEYIDFIILIDFDTTWLYVLLSKLEYETWFMKNYDIRNNKNWQPDCVEDAANGGIYVGNWLSWGFMSPVRPATCRQIDQWQNRQLDQRFQRTWLPDDSQPTASRHAVLWPCHRDNMIIVMVGKKNLRNWWI